uniref:Putative secreted protein n=1 Tax=Ixodes ricinus TaxID=34613 RepID=A0A6B0U1U8_IXORI
MAIPFSLLRFFFFFLHCELLSLRCETAPLVTRHFARNLRATHFFFTSLCKCRQEFAVQSLSQLLTKVCYQ